MGLDHDGHVVSSFDDVENDDLVHRRVFHHEAVLGQTQTAMMRTGVCVPTETRQHGPLMCRYCGWYAYLNLQYLAITSDSLVMHLIVGIIGVAAVLVFDEGKETAGGGTGGGNIAANKAAESV